MPRVTACVITGGLFAVSAAGAAAGRDSMRINVHDYKDAASLHEALRLAPKRPRFHVPPVQRPGVMQAGAPTILYGKILTDKILTSSGAGVPRVEISFNAPNRLSYVGVEFTYPTGQFQDETYYASPPGEKAATRIIEQAAPPWGNYAASGVWQLTSAYITDAQGNQVVYNGAKLTALFPSLTLHVQNDIAPDVTPPTVTGGEILTPIVHANRPFPVFKVNLSVTDDVSGVSSLVLYVEDPSNTYIDGEYTYPPSPLKKGIPLLRNDFFGEATPGTWTIYGYQVCDVPNNCVTVDDPSDIRKLFGTNTFEVVH